MFKKLLFIITAVISLSVFAGDTEAVFADDFDREDADDLGQGWDAKGDVVLKHKAVLFNANEEEFRPRIKHSFPVQKKGKFTVSFRMDWLRKSEGTWAFHIQLGNSTKMPKRLVYPADLSRGIGVHLIWGGGELVDHQKAASLGYSKKGKFEPLFVVNDMQVKDSIVEKAIITIDVDVDTHTYTIKFDGKTYPDLPFDNEGPIDTIRFITNGCSKTGFSKSSIDDIIVSKSVVGETKNVNHSVGVAVDPKGNLVFTEKKDKVLYRLANISGLAFGGEGGRTLYITGAGTYRLYRVQLPGGGKVFRD